MIEVRHPSQNGGAVANNLHSLQKNVRHHLLTILGLAQSNSRAENTLFTARHSLVACKIPSI